MQRIVQKHFACNDNIYVNCVKIFSFFVQDLEEKFPKEQFYAFVDAALDTFRLVY